jgi:large subunit ribosomal protein L9
VKVLLLEDVAHLGRAGTVVTVADGYARNYLIRRKLAKVATGGSMKEVDLIRRAAERKHDRQTSTAQDLARQLDGITLTFRALAGDKGKLYGSITPTDLATALEQRIGQEVDRRKIMTDPLRQIGEHTVEIHLLADVSARVKVVIEPEETAAESPPVGAQ